MQKPRIYLETSIWNFYYAEDAPDFKNATHDLFKSIGSIGEIFISDLVLDEFNAASPTKNKELRDLLTKHKPRVLDRSAEAEALAAAYISDLALPARSTVDALQAAIATIHHIDILLSWNLKHLANYGRMQKINAVNMKNGYRQPLQLLTPLEVIDDGLST